MTRPELSIVISLVAMAVGSPVRADEAVSTLDSVVVACLRTPARLDQVAAAVTVIDAAALEQRQPIAVSDVLATAPGVSVTRNGGFGQTTTVHIRGADSEQTVTVLDGVRLNDVAAPGGGYDFSNLMAGDVARIEVLRGPQSTLWGADAIGGVVNLVTTAPTQALEGQASAEAGSLDTRYLRASLGGALDRLTWRASGGYFQTSGVSAFDARLGGREPDGALNATASARIGYRLTDWASLDLRYWTALTKTAYDGYPPPNYQLADTADYGESRQAAGYAGLKLNGFGGALVQTLSVQENRLDRDTFDPTAAPQRNFYARGMTQTVAWQGEWTLAPEQVLLAGLQSERSTIRTAAPSSFDPDPAPLIAHARLDSAFVSSRMRLAPGLTWSLGLRQDQHDRFGGHATASTGLAYTPDGGVTLWRASFGQGFKTPSLYQLYSDYGNPALRPETANGYDAAVSRAFLDRSVTLGLGVFLRNSRQLIDYVDCYTVTPAFCAARPFGYYANLDRARAQGVEAELSARLTAQLRLSANYTFTDTENLTPGAHYDHDLSRRPRHTAFGELAYRFATGASVSAAVRYSGASFDDAANTTRLKAYVLTDLRAAAPVGGGLELYGRIENLFDRPYETAYGFGQPGRAAYLGLRARY